MKKIAIALACALTLSSYQAYADNVQFNGNVSGTCSVSTPVDGSLDLTTTTVTGDTLSSQAGSGTAASVAVTNNQAGAFAVSVVEGSTTIPTQSGISREMLPALVGANTGATFSGTAASTTRTATLANAGNDGVTLNAKVIRSSAALLPGTYQLTYAITCSAI